MSIFIARYLICAICVNAGGMGSYGEHFGSNELKCKELAGTSLRSSVVTSQRRDVGSTNIEVNKRQRRDVSTSRRLNVATSQHRDVNAISASPSSKAKRGPELDGGEMVRTRARKSEQQRPRPEEETYFCIFSFPEKRTDVL